MKDTKHLFLSLKSNGLTSHTNSQFHTKDSLGENSNCEKLRMNISQSHSCYDQWGCLKNMNLAWNAALINGTCKCMHVIFFWVLLNSTFWPKATPLYLWLLVCFIAYNLSEIYRWCILVKFYSGTWTWVVALVSASILVMQSANTSYPSS